MLVPGGYVKSKLLKKPDDFKVYPDTLISNFNHSIDKEVEQISKGQKLYAQYTAWDFQGYIWFHSGKWNCEVWKYNSHVDTVTALTLEDIMEEISNKYGSD